MRPMINNGLFNSPTVPSIPSILVFLNASREAAFQNEQIFHNGIVWVVSQQKEFEPSAL
jgi:hypothetical protein